MDEMYASLSTLEARKNEAGEAWRATHDRMEELLQSSPLPEKEELTRLLAEEREAHRLYIEEIRAWADAARASSGA